MKCDFCSYENPTWSYTSQPYVSDVIRVPGAALVNGVDARWAACNTCHALIQARDPAGLARRSAETFVQAHPEHPFDTAMVQTFEKVQRPFWAGLQREPERIACC